MAKKKESKEKYWHFKVDNWKKYERIATIDVGDPGGLVIRIGIGKKKGKRGGTTHTVEFMFEKDAYGSRADAKSVLDKILGKDKEESTNGDWNRALVEWKRISGI